MKIANIISAFEEWANPALQESWDNTGLQLGNPARDCTGVLVCFDVTPDVIDEATYRKCNLVISHHPLFFKGVKSLTASNPALTAAMRAIHDDITIYSSHTAADSTPGGVSYSLAERLGIEPKRAMMPQANRLVLLQAIVPRTHAQEVQAALFDAGAGKLGHYDCCSFTVQGQGTFRALEGAHPYAGQIGLSHSADEVSINLVLATESIGSVEAALLKTHPYETPAYQFLPMLNCLPNVGLGVYGIAKEPMSPQDFIQHVKERLGCECVRTTKIDLDPEMKIRRVALCGGAGGEFIPTAIAMGAQAYITGDVKYHDFVDYRDKILVIDAGHYETEAPVKETFAQVIRERFPSLPVYCTDLDDNPVQYQ